MILFQDRNKLVRGKDASHRVDPSCQRLKCRSLSRLDTGDPLIVNLDPPFRHGLIETFDNIALIPQLVLIHEGIEIADPVQVIADPLQRISRMIQRLDRPHPFLIDADAGLDADSAAFRPSPNGVVGQGDVLFQPSALVKGIDQDKMVILTADRQRIRKAFPERLSNMPQELVSFLIAVLAVIIVHAHHICIDENRAFSADPQGMDPFIGKLVHVVEIWQPRQRVGKKLVFPEQMIVLHRPAHRIKVVHQIGIGQHGKLRPVRHCLPFADRMDDMISVLVPGAESEVIPTAVVGKLHTHMRNPSDVIGMNTLKLALQEPGHGMLPVHADQVTEAVRNQQRHDLSVDQLIVYKRNRLSFICFSQFLREYVHAATPLRRWCISCLYREYHNHCEKAMPFSELSLRHASCRTAEFIWKETSEILASCGTSMV